ncbi:MAG TPA: glycosyltransferase [Casimicrobiaceae bacterium]|nr:glycosyltransferase [Casimicrobiaceae bacterium]
MSSRSQRVAIVHDWLDTWRGGENVLAEIVHLYPRAELFALVDFLPDAQRARLGGKRARTTFLQHIPGARRHFRGMLPLFPRAIESLDLSGFDTIISSSHAVAKGVRTASGQRHVCYCHTPMRYAWDLRAQYLATTGLDRGVKGWLAQRMLDRLRDWDRRTSARVSQFVANSHFIAERIRRCYERDAVVVYPPVDTRFFTPHENAAPPAERDYFFTASHWVPYKRIDLIAAAFRDLSGARLIVAGTGPEGPRIRAQASPNVEFVGDMPRERLRELMRGARAFVFAAEEDFGIMPVEAQACGTPVIAYGRGGVLESVVTGELATGLLFHEQSAAAIAAAIAAFDRMASRFEVAACRASAERFTVDRFRTEFLRVMEAADDVENTNRSVMAVQAAQ